LYLEHDRKSRLLTALSVDDVVYTRTVSRQFSVMLIVSDVYHVTFDMPSSSAVASRLKVADGCGVDEMVKKLVVYHRNIGTLKASFEHNIKTINADQPKADVYMQGE